MKQKIVPTSPKSTERPQRSTPVFTHHTLVSVCIGLVFGIAGGVVGSIYTQNIINGIQDVGNSTLFHLNRSTSHELSSMKGVHDSIAAVYMSDGFTTENFVDYAIVVSSDGWLALSDEHFTPASNLAVRLYSGAEATVQRTLPRPDLGIVFLKLNRVDLRPVTFSSTQPSIGAVVTAFGATADRSVFVEGSVSEMRPLNNVSSSVLFQRRFFTHSTLAASVPLFDASHALFGWQRSTGEIIPASWIHAAFLRIDAEAVAPLEILYTSVRTFSSTDRKALEYPEQGWVVVADVGEFKKNDVIVRIDHLAVDDGLDLATIMSHRVPGAQISFEVLRAGSTETITMIAQ